MHTSDEKALAQEMLEKYESDSRFRQFKGKMAVFITALAVIWGLFQLYVSSFGVMDAIILRSWHVIFLLIFAFLLFPARRKTADAWRRWTWWDALCTAAGLFAFGYLIVHYRDIALRGGYLLPMDYVVALVGLLVVFEAARRTAKSLAIPPQFFSCTTFSASICRGFSATSDSAGSELWSTCFGVDKGCWASGPGCRLPLYLSLFCSAPF